MHSKKNGHRALSDQEFQRNLELLDLVVGSWTDQFESTYSVQLDGGIRQDSCSVFTMRKSGRTLKTRALIRVKEGKVWWSTNYTLDRAKATSKEIRWIPRAKDAKIFQWKRRKEALSQEEIGRKVKAMREKEQALAPSEVPDPEADDGDVENESDDDDIVAEAHPWKKERRPIPVEDIRWSQDTIGIRFRDGKYLVDTLKAMLLGRMKPEELPAMHVVLHEDVLFAITGNRRLWVLKNYARISNKEVRVFAEVHPPAAMSAKWVKRRYTSHSLGQEVRFLHKSFADVTYESMKDALKVAEGLQGPRVKLLENMEKSRKGQSKRCTSGKAWQAIPNSTDSTGPSDEPDKPGTPVQEEEEQKQEEQAEEEPLKEFDPLNDQDQVAQRALLKLLSPDWDYDCQRLDPPPEPPAEMPQDHELDSMAGQQLLYAAGLLIYAADSHEQMDAQSQLRQLGYRLQEAAAGSEVAVPGADLLQQAAGLIQQVVEEIEWIDCPHDLGMQLLQAAQMLEMASYSWWSSSPEDMSFDNLAGPMEGSFEQFEWSPNVFTAEDFPQAPWLWQWQMAGQMASLRSICGYWLQ